MLGMTMNIKLLLLTLLVTMNSYASVINFKVEDSFLYKDINPSLTYSMFNGALGKLNDVRLTVDIQSDHDISYDASFDYSSGHYDLSSYIGKTYNTFNITPAMLSAFAPKTHHSDSNPELNAVLSVRYTYTATPIIIDHGDGEGDGGGVVVGVVPEPKTYILLLIGLITFYLYRKFNKINVV